MFLDLPNSSLSREWAGAKLQGPGGQSWGPLLLLWAQRPPELVGPRIAMLTRPQRGTWGDLQRPNHYLFPSLSEETEVEASF